MMRRIYLLEDSALTPTGTGEENFSLSPTSLPNWYDLRFNDRLGDTAILRIDARTMLRLGEMLVGRVNEDHG